MLRRLALFLSILLVVGIMGGLLAEKIPYRNTYENRLYLSGQYHVESVPAGTHVTGYVRGDKFSVYVLDSENLKRFKNGEEFKAIYSWRNTNYVKLDFNASRKLYVVIKNEESGTQFIKLRLKAEKP